MLGIASISYPGFADLSNLKNTEDKFIIVSIR
jgi:hypothetical protein